MNKYDLSAIPNVHIGIQTSYLVKTCEDVVIRDNGGDYTFLFKDQTESVSMTDYEAYKLALWILNRKEPF